MIKDKSIQLFLDELASKAPTPGGGSAAAIMGAMGAALLGMVCNLTVGKKNYEAVEADMRTALEQAERLRMRLTDMIRADVDAFDQVMAAYGLPKETDVEKQARSQAIQSALKAATEVPLECALACAEVVSLSRTVAAQGNKNVISDAGVAVVAAYAGLKSAALNVYVNVSSIKDEAFVSERLSQLNAIVTGTQVSSEEIYQEVKNKL